MMSQEALYPIVEVSGGMSSLTTVPLIVTATMKTAGAAIAGMTLMSIISWMVVNTYVYLCAPPSLLGALKMMFTMGSPVCQYMNGIQYEISKKYVSYVSSVVLATLTYSHSIAAIYNNHINIIDDPAQAQGE